MTDRQRCSISPSRSASRDLANIAAYLAEQRSEAFAAEWVSEMLDSITQLEIFPDRGPVPHELEVLGRNGYRQWSHGKYRIFYRLNGKSVLVFLIADGRRDMAALLRERVLGSDRSL